MNYWLIKSEPETYSYERLESEGKTMWDGVRNYAARNYLRGMEVGDLALFYHSVKGLEVVGICKVVKAAYPDPSAEKGDWSVVDFIPLQRLNQPVSLHTIKQTPDLQQIGLVRIGRLSVMPLQKTEFEKILTLGNTTL
ncbi:MAG: EVE domain-containing protein [Saprospiraceae bacterium]|nr:EVE domain-containing protein [Saprospiraceae bacterium]